MAEEGGGGELEEAPAPNLPPPPSAQQGMEQGRQEQQAFTPRRSAGFWRQLKATLVRNLLRKKRALRHTLRVSF